MYHDLYRQALIRKLEYVDPSKGKNEKKRKQFRAESMESMKNDKINKKDDNRHWLLHYVDQTVAVTEDDFFVRKNDFNKATGRYISIRTVDLCLAKPNEPVLLSDSDKQLIKTNTELLLFEPEIFKIKKVDKKPKEYEYVVLTDKLLDY